MRPLLERYADGTPRRIAEVEDEVAQHFDAHRWGTRRHAPERVARGNDMARSVHGDASYDAFIDEFEA